MYMQLDINFDHLLEVGVDPPSVVIRVADPSLVEAIGISSRTGCTSDEFSPLQPT